MSNLTKLSDSELAEVLKITEAEVARRRNIKRAVSEISKILKKYDIELSDIFAANQSRQASKNTQKMSRTTKKAQIKKPSKSGNETANTDRRSNVKAKYCEPGSNQTWSGRGRCPSWVINACKREKISLEEFKSSKTYSIDSDR